MTALGISKDYYIVVCRYLYMKLSEIHQLELYDVKTGKYERAVKGMTPVKSYYYNGDVLSIFILFVSSAYM